MPAMSSSPLQRLPDTLAVKIAVRVAATSMRPMDDLRSLRATCKDMRQACKDKEVRRCIPLGLVLARAFFDDNVTDFDLFRDTLVNNLAEASHPEACFQAGLRDIFGVNRGSLQPCLEELKTAADAGHKLAAYMRALCLYRRNSGTDDDAEVMRLIREVEGNEDAAAPAAGGGGPTPWMNLGCMRCRGAWCSAALRPEGLASEDGKARRACRSSVCRRQLR